MKKVVNSRTNPLGIPEYADVEFHRFTSQFVYNNLQRSGLGELTHQITDWFERQLDIETELSQYQYTRPRVRGTDGQLYSESDMDHLMMGY